jgi:hypothetical protein
MKRKSIGSGIRSLPDCVRTRTREAWSRNTPARLEQNYFRCFSGTKSRLVSTWREVSGYQDYYYENDFIF